MCFDAPSVSINFCLPAKPMLVVAPGSKTANIPSARFFKLSPKTATKIDVGAAIKKRKTH
jgi:hypothetical protein